MKAEDNKMDGTIDSVPCEIVESEKNKFRILVTYEDIYGRDITKMSNFFDEYIQQLSSELSTNSTVDVISKIPVADIGIINDVIRHLEVVMDGNYGYVPDFDNLPTDIKTKFQQGIYKIGESKQVDGNMRAVILDENDVRVKDITLKRVLNNPDSHETIHSIANQVQMRQIFAKLEEMKELQSYQIDRDRDRDIVTPFLNARFNILRAQETESLESKKDYLNTATAELTAAINAIYSDLSTSSEHLVKATERPIFQKPWVNKEYLRYITLDLQMATKLVGVQMHVFDYLGDKVGSKLAWEGYQHVMQDFFTKSINQKNQSAAILIHQHYPYKKHNRNFWMKFAADSKLNLPADINSIEKREILLVSIEDIENDEENK